MKNFVLNWVCVRATGAGKKVLAAKDGKKIDWWLFDKKKNWFTQCISGVSLASIILLPYEDETTICHEYGHSMQSLYLGWSYLPIIGIYSAVFCNLWDRWFHRRWNRYDRHYWYYKTRWTEKWADALGGVDRDAALRNIPRPANAKYPAVTWQRMA